MASVTVSKAAFKSHLIELGIDALTEKFASEGIETYTDTLRITWSDIFHDMFENDTFKTHRVIF